LKNNKYDSWSKEELVREIAALKKQKTYGLVWDRDKTKESFDLFINWDAEKAKEEFGSESKDKFPVLAEVKNKEIRTKKAAPVNLLIEGDNYHSLAVLNFTHKNSVDLIYIDPPYNTGNNDFRYNDKFVDKEDGYKHSKWLSFMSKRLALAKNLLKKTGVIFISIDDNEHAQIKLLCDGLFGETNFVANIIWEKKFSPQNDAKWFSDNHDYILVYAKDKDAWRPHLLPRTETSNARYSNSDNDPRGPWTSGDLTVKSYTPNYDYPITTPSKRAVNPTRGRCWFTSKEKMQELIKDNRIWFGKSGGNVPRLKIFLSEAKEGIVPMTIWKHGEAGHNQEARQELKNILPDSLFDNPKPTKLIKRILKVASNKDSTILDFFAGSGTTGHAVLEMNKEDGGERNFILCTNNENNICTDVCYPRIIRVIKGYTTPKREKMEGMSGNLRYYKTDFVEADPTDKNKRKLVDKCTEMLCIKENAFEQVKEGARFKIFKNNNIHLGIIFDDEYIEDFIKLAQKIDGQFNVYVFSHDDSVPTREFKTLKNRVTLCPIPETILRVYRKVFAND